MSYIQSIYTNLILQKNVKINKNLLFILKSLCGSLFIAAFAQVQIPFWPVPFTMHEVAVLVVGLVAAPAVASASVLLYIAEAAVGLPICHGFKGGLTHLFGTTGGYIAGFWVMALMVSHFKARATTYLKLFFLSLAAAFSMYFLGVAWLSSFVGIEKAIALGLIPFLVPLPFKIIFAIFTKNLVVDIKKYMSK